MSEQRAGSSSSSSSTHARRPTSSARSQSSNSINASLSQVWLSSPTRSSPSQNGRLSLAPVEVEEDEDEEDGDIGFGLPPLPASRRASSSSPTEISRSLRATPPLESGPFSPRVRTLTRSRTPSPTPTQNGNSSSRRASSPNSVRSASIRSFNQSPPPPQPDFHTAKPPIPASVAIPSSGEPVQGVGDGSETFESIPLSTTPPPPPSSSVPLPTSPGPPLNDHKGKSGSWSGFGATKDGERFAYGQTTPPHVRGDSHSSSTPNGASTSNGSTPPRRQAPPAHPHPFPLPSTPPLSSKRLSAHSSTSSLPRPPSTQAQAHPPTHAHMHGLGVKGAPTLDKFISHTRPQYLPPKDRAEDDTHLHQWEEIMAQSRHLEAERRKAQEIHRAEKDRKIALATPHWEALLSDPGFSVAKVRSNPHLRKLWFDGIPSHLRGKAWALAVGNPLAMSKDAYKMYVSRARKAIGTGRFPQDILDQMENDMDNTLPVLRMFVRGSPMRADLRELLCAWVVCRSDEGLGYAPYISYLAAMLLLTSAPSAAFHILVNLLSRPLLRAFYTETTDEIEAFYRVFENLQADTFPIIYANCKNLGLRLPEGWFRSLLVEWVPFEAACRLWDQIVLDGDGYVFRAALAIFGFLEPRLYYPDKDEIASVLEGRNRATMAITERERERARLKGEAVLDALDGKLSVFGLNEDALFEWLKDDGWKESRFERLVVREMPD
ncbi:rab-GTPase-TBC domain-domain-containing protein [Naematelia encephala]|uniref:Rab-GTPase-TBC domain-domain-containing protein n=1 Tax=Naematelia encephala TaxID=71784 RepID=A0A1Y2BJ88_9TREE|nr:rab-GTPase-TBC domain-domain-containing protein [Naematelia encephala]